jgi:amino acid transporter
MMQQTGPPEPAGTGTAVVQTALKRDAIGLVGATMQAITHIAPAIAALFFTQFVVSLAGITAPLAYLVGVIVVLMLGSTLVQLSKHLPSAGGYFTYVSRALHPRAGFLTSWMYVLYSPLAGGPIYGFFGFILAGELQANYHLSVPWLWWVCVLAGAPLIAFLQYRGIEISARAMLILGGLEMALVFTLGLWGFFQPGPGGFTFSVFNFNNKLSVEGFALAVVFSVQGLTGWEAAAPLAEETRNPRRNVPRATMLSIVLLGVFLVLTFWGVIMGFGTKDVHQLITASQLPGLVLAQRFWGSAGWVILVIAFFNSTIAVCLATANVGTRMWYGMARNGSFPRALASVHPAHKTPTNAILAQLALSLAVGIGIGFWVGADVSFFLVDGLVLVLGVLFVYVMANAAVVRFYLREHRREFNFVLHILFPVISTAALAYATVKSFQPFPASPYKFAPLIDGLWLAAGVAVLLYMRARRREDWILTAGRALGEGEPELERTVGYP